MKDSAKRLRIEMTAGGIAGIAHSRLAEVGLVRKDFFVPQRKPSSSKDQIDFIKETANKSWQLGTLERLIKAGAIEQRQDKQEVYYVAKDYDLLKRINEDHKNGGPAVAHFVFPTEAPSLFGALPGENTHKELSVADLEDVDLSDAKVTMTMEQLAEYRRKVEADAKAEIVPVGTEIEVSFEQLVVAMAQNVATIKQKQEATASYVIELSKTFIQTSESQTEFFKELSGIFKSYEKSDDKILAALTTVENRQHGNNKRIDELETLLKGQRQLLDSNQTIMRRLADSVDKIVEAAEAIVPLRATITESTQSVNDLVKEIRNTEKANLNQLAERVARASEEMKTLSGALLEAAIAGARADAE